MIGTIMAKPQILLTNDDGIRSPGLWAAAASLSDLGYVTVTAPRDQSSGMGRSLPNTSDGIIHLEQVQVNGQEWSVYAVGGSPAQSVLHGVLEVLKFKPDLVVSGINYGENVASGVTISGTVGAAMEAASLGIPAMAVSLETDAKYHLSYSDEVNFSVAADFARRFARLLMEKKFPADMDLLKVDIPWDATLEEDEPVMRSLISPPLKSIRVGMPITPYCIMMFGFWSASSLTTLTLPSHSPASCLTMGSIILQGWHQTALKSTKTGRSAPMTSS
jgi:5'/3'-nucleotidase SurE